MENNKNQYKKYKNTNKVRNKWNKKKICVRNMMTILNQLYKE